MHEDLWQRTLVALSSTLDPVRYETWLTPLLVMKDNNPQKLTLCAPNQYIRDFLEQFYKQTLLSTVRSLSSDISELAFVVQSGPPAEDEQPKPQSPPPREPTPSSPQVGLNKRFTFDSFVVGSGNEFAKSAAFAVAESPGKTKFNPLLIYGGVGLGKTHLLQAIGNYLLGLGSYKVAYITSEEFYLSFIDAIKSNNTKNFSARFRSVDALLMDDIQFFSGKESTQEEFFFIFNTLYQNAHQIVLTSDLPPAALKGLQERLISRFQWGLCVDIQPPNLETRVAILKKKAEEGNLNISQDVLYFIAENVSSNIRELEGIVIRLLAYASITKSDVTIDLVRTIIKSSLNKQKSRVTIDHIIEKVSEYYNIPVNNLRERNRRKEVAHARQMAMYIAKSITDYSLKTIGLNFGGRDHSTVIHAITQIDAERKSDQQLERDINFLIASVEG